LAKRAVAKGVKAAEEASSPGQVNVVEEAAPGPLPPPRQEPIPVREDSEFDTEEDGQLRLC